MMIEWLGSDRDRPRVLIAGGGVAALEACLFLRAYVREDDVEIELLSPNGRFAYRPLSVLEPFGGAPTWCMGLDRFAADQDLTLNHDGLAEVLQSERAVRTASGAQRSYDLLLIAIGARQIPDIPGALTFHGSADAPTMRLLLDDAVARLRPRIAFAVGAAASWTLPLYELALMTAAELTARGARTELTVVTPEAAPLAMFGPKASALVAQLLDEHGIAVISGAEPLAVEDGELRLVDGRVVTADRVVALPRAAGQFIAGLPHDPAGFIPVDPHGRVEGVDAVYAAGDITTFPFKQGGVATQQADAAAEAMLADLGLPLEPRPFTPVLQGVLYTESEPAYLCNPLADSAAPVPEPRAYSLWWPPSKIAGRFLSPYLTVQAGAPRAPEVRPSADVVPVRVDVASAIAHGTGPTAAAS